MVESTVVARHRRQIHWAPFGRGFVSVRMGNLMAEWLMVMDMEWMMSRECSMQYFSPISGVKLFAAAGISPIARASNFRLDLSDFLNKTSNCFPPTSTAENCYQELHLRLNQETPSHYIKPSSRTLGASALHHPAVSHRSKFKPSKELT